MDFIFSLKNDKRKVSEGIYRFPANLHNHTWKFNLKKVFKLLNVSAYSSLFNVNPFLDYT